MAFYLQRNMRKIAVPKIFVNGLNAKSGGGKSILTNFLTLLATKGSPYQFIVIVPNSYDYSIFSSSEIKIIPMPIFSATLCIPFVNSFYLPFLVRKLKVDLIFNLADIPIPTNIKQIFLFDWPYAVYPNSPAWKLGDLKSFLIRKLKLFFFKKYLIYVDTIIAQSESIKRRLEIYYNLKFIKVIQNAVSVDNISANNIHDFKLGSGLKLLCLSYYYSHKNIEIFLPLAQIIKAKGLNIKIITTIEAHHNKKALIFLQKLKSESLDKIIINIGSVPMSLVPSLYTQIDGLLLPTLLESFSGTYVEAMFHKKPIFTSNLDFATDVCSDAAFYFDPYDANQILDRILECINEPINKQIKIERGLEVLEKLPSWDQAFDKYIELFTMVLDIKNEP